MAGGQGAAGGIAEGHAEEHSDERVTPQKPAASGGTGLSPEGYSGQAAFEARLAGLERSFTPPLVPPSNLRTYVAGVEGAANTGDTAASGGHTSAEQLTQHASGGSSAGGGAEEIDLLYAFCGCSL